LFIILEKHILAFVKQVDTAPEVTRMKIRQLKSIRSRLIVLRGITSKLIYWNELGKVPG